MEITTTSTNVKAIVFFLNINILLVLIFISVSCSRITYKNTGDIPVFFTPQNGHNKNFNINSDVDFYLFGLIPKKHTIFLDRLGKIEGFTEISKLEIYEKTSWKDFLYMFFSLGIYTPRTVLISGWGIKN
ncbi:MAG: hypothetical protein HQK51_04330 [Oligoflexia bacterium]|nr:hypothetical protein [Oligoflexia bacterium]